ncbi:MAG: hypothetical protein AAGH15_17915 [Myxococcota bacterium]
MHGAAIAAIAVAFSSLAAAYGRNAEGLSLRRIALRVVFYRGWLVTLPPLAGHLAVWAAPAGATEGAVAIASFAALALMVLLVLTLLAAARESCGCGSLSSIAVVAVPFLLMSVSNWALLGGAQTEGMLERWLPDDEAIRRALPDEPAAEEEPAAPEPTPTRPLRRQPGEGVSA